MDTDKYGNFLRDNEDSQALNLMASINIPGSFKGLQLHHHLTLILLLILITYLEIGEKITFFKI